MYQKIERKGYITSLSSLIKKIKIANLQNFNGYTRMT